jgi:uncharacterized membrane protein
MTPFEETIKLATGELATGIETAAAAIIGFAALRGLFLLLTRAGADSVRMYLGRYLSLALEFEVAADILRTAVAPTWTQIGQLAAIVALRTALNYFLQREIQGEAYVKRGMDSPPR